MRWIIVMLSCCGILIHAGTGVIAASHSESQRFSIGQYTKVIVSGNKLYIGDGQGVLFPYGGSVIVASLTGDRHTDEFPAYTGVFVEDLLESGGELSPIGNQYQFCWDLANGQLFSINIRERRMRAPFFEFMGIPVKWVENSSRLREIDPRVYRISYLAPLEELLFFAFIQKRFRVFFDMVAFEEQAFHLYISYQGIITVWSFDKEVNASLRAHRREMSGEEIAKAEEEQWQEIASVPVEFEGPFRVIQLETKTYIFSEQTRCVYQLERDQLTPLLHLPPLPGEDSAGMLGNVFIVDKDRNQALFFVPSPEHPDNPGVITLGDLGSVREGLTPALQSALDLFKEPKEVTLERWMRDIKKDTNESH